MVSLVHQSRGAIWYQTELFIPTKCGIVEPTCVMLNKWKSTGRAMTHVWLDNAGEDYLLQNNAILLDWKLVMTWEFTSRNTPQQNSNAEAAFWKIKHRGKDMMIAAIIPKTIQLILHREAFETASKLDLLTSTAIDGVIKSYYEHWMGDLPSFVRHMRVGGEIATVTYTKDTSAKLEDRG